MLSPEELEAENRRKEELMKRWAQQPLTYKEVLEQQRRNNAQLGIVDSLLDMSEEERKNYLRSLRKKTSTRSRGAI